MPNKVRNGIKRLRAAVRRGNIKKVRWLLSRLENSKILAGQLLHIPVAAGDESVVRLLLEYAADVDAVGEYSRTPLHTAVLYQKETVVNLLLDRGAQTNIADSEGNSPLHLAARLGSGPVVERLLEFGADIDAANRYLQTPLLTAFLYEKETVANLLLDRGAQVNVVDGLENRPLHLAARGGGSVQVIEKLLGLGAVVDPINSYNETPLLIAAEGRNCEAVIALLRHGASPKAKRNNGSTALHSAAEWGDESIVKNLIYYGADPKACDSIYYRPLHYSIHHNHPEVTRILLENFGYVSNMCCFFTEMIVKKGTRSGTYPYYSGDREKMSEILRLHLLDLEVRNMWQRARNGDCCSCRSLFKDHIKGDVDGEIEKMKRRSVVEGITLYDLITKSKNQMVPLVRNTSLLEALVSVDVGEDLPVFGGLFKYKWDAAFSRGKLILGGVSAFGSLMVTSVACQVNVNDALGDALRCTAWEWMLGFFKVSPDMPTADFLERLKRLDSLLPGALVDDILSRLTDTDLRNMITAAQLTN